MLFQAARTLELKDEQKTKIDAAEKTAHEGPSDASRDAIKTATKNLHADLVAGIRTGKVEAAKLEPHYAAMEKVSNAAHDKEVEALNVLHATLDATQRKAAVASARAKQAAREEKMAQRTGKDDAGVDGGAASARVAKRGMDFLTRGLDLDAEQQKKVDALTAKDDGKGGRPDQAETKKKTEALLVAFEKDTFDAKKVDAFDTKRARGSLEQQTKLVVQLVPLLKPEQREKLAINMEKGPSPHNRRSGFGHRAVEENDDD